MPVNIHGKEYKTVAERLEEFHKAHKGKRIVTEIISNDDEYVVMKANILDATDNLILATGHAQEKYGSTNINQTSALENCETSAIGRALACFGMAGSEFASADEVASATMQQSNGDQYRPKKLATPAQKNLILKLYTDTGGEPDMVTDFLKGEGYDPEKLTTTEASKIIKELKGE